MRWRSPVVAAGQAGGKGGMDMAAIAIGADNAGAPLKEHLARYLEDHGYEVKDYGNAEFADYPDVAAQVAEAVGRGEHDRALLVCGTGLGMAITANKVPGVRAARATSG
jgi:ribose 5-phosphate isomerase B